MNFIEYFKVRNKYFGEGAYEAFCNYQNYEKHMKKKDKMHTHTLSDFVVMPGTYCLAPTPVPCTAPVKKGCIKKQEEENLMNYASASVIATPATTETQDQRKYLAKRLDEVYHNHRDGLEAKFGLTDDEAPHGPKELAERLAAGKFSIRGTGDDEKNAGSYRYWTAGDLIRWRDPAKKADQDGFDAARADLKAKKQAALDIIKIDEPKAGLDAVKALEAWEPTGAAN
jgi:hypothetical protein